MADTDQFDNLTILARTIWGEARGEGDIGMEAVASVIMNRANSKITWWGDDVRSVCLARWQFSCWNDSDPNREKLMSVTVSDMQFSDALHIAAIALNSLLVDPVQGATSYYDARMPEAPKWAEGRTPVTQIGHHLFFVDPLPKSPPPVTENFEAV